MEFQNNSQPIFLQIFDLICDRILQGEIKVNEQIPSVREIAIQYEVNPNTVMRTIERLLSNEIVYSQRGKGNYLSEGACKTIQALRTKRLFEEKLPRLANEIKLLGITPEEVAKRLKEL